MQGTSRSDLAAELQRCARECENAAALYADRHDGDVVSALLLAAAALDTAVRMVERDDSSESQALMIAATLSRDAIASAVRRGLDEQLAQCVASLQRVVSLCDDAL